MTKEEAEKLSDTPEVADGLLKIFTKEIDDYTREDFIDGTEPYDYLMLYKDDLFNLERKKQKIDAVARKCGVRNFPKLFSEYCTKHGTDVGSYNVTNFPSQPLTLRCGNYICDQSGVKLDNEIICPHPIMIVARLVNIDTGVEKIKIAFSNNRGWRTAIYDRKIIFTANKITDLSELGISVTSESARNLVKYFAKLEELNFDLIGEQECVTRMGWIHDQDELKFVPYVDSIVFDGEAEYKKSFEAIKPRGSLDKWIDFIDKNVHGGSVIARIVFATSLASVLVQPLGCLPFFIHLWGETESAKTVLAMAAASIWANPTVGVYFKTFDSTFVGMERSAAFCNNLPLMLDELQIINDRKDFEKEIYMLTEGSGRTRGNKTGGLDLVPTWKNCIITTGEKPILSGSSGGGAVNRVLEVECKKKFFDEPRNAANFLKENYGLFGRAFIAKLLNGGLEEAEKLFTDYYNELTGAYEITQKQASSAALILTADKLATDLAFRDGTNLTPKEISEFLKTKASVSINPRAYEYVCEFVAANQNKFMGASEYGESWGIMACYDSGASSKPDEADSVYILKNKFNQICADGGYNAASLLSWLSDRKMIRRTDKKHYDVLKVIGRTKVRCVHLMLNRSDNDDFTDIDL